ncbi:hypothetical protein BKA93DRAFT_815112 [Sparassis latifolia]
MAPPEYVGLDELSDLAQLSEMKLSMKFIRGLEQASLDDEGMRLDADTLERLRNPPCTTVDVTDPSLRLALDLFLATYNTVRDAIMRRYPDDILPSYAQIKRQVAELSGVVPLIHDMCINSCLAYTGPFSALETCPKCGESRGGQKKIARLQLQALRQNPASATALNYRAKRTEEILETLQQNDGNLPAYEDLASDDIVLMLSLGGFIPGLGMWDAARDTTFLSHPFLALEMADGPGMVYLNGFPGGSHYYPALLKPLDYDVEGCDHDDINIHSLPACSSEKYMENLRYLMMSSSETQYRKRRLETGITKPSIFLEFSLQHTLGIPGSFGSDIMHLASLNLPDLLIPLKATWDWAIHGQAVADATPYLPGSFDAHHTIPQKKSPFLIYIFELGPGLLYGILPDKYWKNFCKLHKITRNDLQQAHKLLLQFCIEFELLYYQRRVDRLHFVWPCVHSLLHLGTEVVRWTMERTIGNLVNALKSMIPDLEPMEDNLPKHAINLGSGYRTATPLHDCEAVALTTYVHDTLGLTCNLSSFMAPSVQRWAHLRLPNGQEKMKALKNVRMARNVKISVNNKIKSLALISLYSRPHTGLLRDAALQIVDVNTILAVVAMVPHNPFGDADHHFFVVEKPGLDVAHMGQLLVEPHVSEMSSQARHWPYGRSQPGYGGGLAAAYVLDATGEMYSDGATSPTPSSASPGPLSQSLLMGVDEQDNSFTMNTKHTLSHLRSFPVNTSQVTPTNTVSISDNDAMSHNQSECPSPEYFDN